MIGIGIGVGIGVWWGSRGLVVGGLFGFVFLIVGKVRFM